MNRSELQRIARSRTEDAKALLDDGRFSGAYYILGYAVECALKACLAKQTRRYDFPDRKLVNASHTHDLESLLRVSGLYSDLQTESRTNRALDENWAVVKDWTVDSRYDVNVSGSRARDFSLGCHREKEWSSVMAEEAVVKELLTDEMIDAGAELTRRLDSTALPVSSCLWLFMSESNLWRLVIASPEVTTSGPKKTYRKIRSVLSEMPGALSQLTLSDIGVVEENDRLISLLRSAIKTGNGISGIRFSRNTINGQFIDDAYIYRLT
ncbi:MAG: HEPN domain-containing protein [Chloroflexi bacterium]|nr:HEPN domain-containing protein [Chloroflexota bacterium]